MAASRLQPFPDAEAASNRYGAGELRLAERKRDEAHKARVAELRRRFVEGPVLTLPNGRMNSFTTAGMTPIPGAGTVYPTFRTSGDWGALDGVLVLMSADRSKLTVPGPWTIDGATVSGEGWTLKLAAGWVLRRGTRDGEFAVVKE